MTFHINERGDSGECHAGKGDNPKGCPFGEGAIHAETQEEARAMYEERQEKQLFATHKAEKETPTFGQVSYNVYAHDLNLVESKIEAANRRLARNGIAERFTYITVPYEEVAKDERGNRYMREKLEIYLNKPSISYSGKKFLAVVSDETGEGLIVKTGSNIELKGWRPENQLCEHCNQVRHRNKTYLIEDENGNRKQIGSTCVDAYLGIRPEGLWAIGHDPLADIDDEKYLFDSPQNSHQEVDKVLALALALSNDGAEFVSKSYAYDYNKISTTDSVTAAMYPSRNEDMEWVRESNEKAEAYLKSGRVQEVKDAVNAMDGDTDYAANLKSIINGEWVSERSMGLLVSSLSAFRKAKENESELKKWTSGYAAPVDAKVRGMKVKVISNNIREVEDNYSYHGGTITKSAITMQDENGHQIVWWASRVIRIKEGEEIELTNGKVKKHDNYKGIDQTIVTGLKMPEQDIKEWRDEHAKQR